MANSPERHPSNHELELYLLDRLTPDAVTRIEEHYLGCRYCVGRISAAADFIEIHNVTPDGARAHRLGFAGSLQRSVLPRHRISKATTLLPWANLAASVLIVAAATSIYYRDSTNASAPALPAAPLPAPIVARVPDRIVAPVHAAVAEQAIRATVAPPSRKLRHVRWATASKLRPVRRGVPSQPGKMFEPPPSKGRVEYNVPGLEMPGLEIVPVDRAAKFEPSAPAVPQFRPKHNRLVRVLSAIGRHLKPKSA
jgi:hypothetical protein